MAPAIGTGVDGPDFVGERVDVLTVVVVFVPGNWIFPLVAAAYWTATLDNSRVFRYLDGWPWNDVGNFLIGRNGDNVRFCG